jgi:peroxiredoxin Q/BCP
MLKLGDTLPDLTLTDEAGNALALKDVGKAVFFIYPKAMTPGCTAEACDFRDRYERLQAAGYAVYGVSPDPARRNAKFRDLYDLSYPLLSDEGHEFLTEVGAWGEKKNYGKTFLGVIRSTVVTDEDGAITHFFRNVKATGHAARVAKELGLAEA